MQPTVKPALNALLRRDLKVRFIDNNRGAVDFVVQSPFTGCEEGVHAVRLLYLRGNVLSSLWGNTK